MARTDLRNMTTVSLSRAQLRDLAQSILTGLATSEATDFWVVTTGDPGDKTISVEEYVTQGDSVIAQVRTF